jgi:hypothetical protein
MPRGDAFDLQILTGIACQLEHLKNHFCIGEPIAAKNIRLTNLGCQVFQDGCTVHGSGSTYSSMAGCSRFQMTMDTTNGKLEEKMRSEVRTGNFQGQAKTSQRSVS